MGMDIFGRPQYRRTTTTSFFVTSLVSLVSVASLSLDASAQAPVDGPGYSVFKTGDDASEKSASLKSMPSRQLSFEMADESKHDSRVQGDGSEATGTFAIEEPHDGRAMFRQPPAGLSTTSPAANGLRRNVPAIDKNTTPSARPALPPRPMQPLVSQDARNTQSARVQPAAPASSVDRHMTDQSPVSRVADSRSTAQPVVNNLRGETINVDPAVQPAAFQQGQESTFGGLAPVQRTASPQRPASRSNNAMPGQAGGGGFSGGGGGLSPRTNAPAAATTRQASSPQNPFGNQSSQRRNGTSANLGSSSISGSSAIAGSLSNAGSSATVGSTSNAGSANSAKQILAAWSVADRDGSDLPGQPVSLLNLIQQPLAASRQSAINQYWVTYYDWANQQIASEQQKWLGSINVGNDSAERGMLQAAQQSANNLSLSREIQLGKSQLKLRQLLPMFGRSNSGPMGFAGNPSAPTANTVAQLLPLPSDSPTVAEYTTKYQHYQGMNRMPVRLQGIDAMLPKAHELIMNRAETVMTARTAAQQALASYKSNKTPLSTVIESARLWQTAEEKFVGSVISYNQAITDYALNLRQDVNRPDYVVAMLIGRPKPKQTQSTNATNVSSQQAPPASLSSATSKFNSGQTYQATMPDNEQQPQSASLGSENTSQNNVRSVANVDNSFKFGPTADSAAAANFDRSKLKTAATPYRDAKPSGRSVQQVANDGYRGGMQSQASSQPAATQPPTSFSSQPPAAKPAGGGNGGGGFNRTARANTNGQPAPRPPQPGARPPQPDAAFQPTNNGFQPTRKPNVGGGQIFGGG